METPVPRPFPRFATIVVTVAAAFVALLGVRYVGDIVAPLLLTANLFIAAYPVQVWLMRRGLPRPLGQVVLGLLVFAILGLFFYALAWSLASLIQALPAYQPQFRALYADVVALLAGFGITETQLVDQLRHLDLNNLTGVLRGAYGGVTNALSVVAVVVTMAFMMTIDAGTFRRRQAQLERHTPVLWGSMRSFVGGVRRYWVVTSLFGLVVAVLDVVALAIIGVPLALVWGILSFLTNYIPNVGFVIGLLPPALMALLALGPWQALAVVGVYSVLNFVIQSVVQPKFNGDAVGVTATVSFLSLLLWSWVLGPLGALLGLPMTLLVKALLIDNDPQMRWLNAFISNEPETADPEGSVEGPDAVGQDAVGPDAVGPDAVGPDAVGPVESQGATFH